MITKDELRQLFRSVHAEIFGDSKICQLHGTFGPKPIYEDGEFVRWDHDCADFCLDTYSTYLGWIHKPNLSQCGKPAQYARVLVEQAVHGLAEYHEDVARQLRGALLARTAPEKEEK